MKIITKLKLMAAIALAAFPTARVQAGLPMPADTAVYYGFDDAANLGGDGSGNGQNIINKTGTAQSDINGKFGGCLYLDGTTRWGTISGAFPAGVPTGASPYTVSAWIKADTGCSTGAAWIGYGNWGATNQNNVFRLDGNYTSVWNYWFNNDFGGVMPSGNFQDGWHHVVGTWDGSTQRLYIDGTQVNSRTPAAPNIGTGAFNIGARPDGGDLWKGWMDDVLIVKSALTQQEITDLQTGIVLSVTYNITASAGTGGAISPAGVSIVAENGTPTYTITPGIGYDIADVVLDGTTSLGPVTTYTFAAVTAAHTIAATFVAVAPHTITASADTGGSISPDGAVSVAHRDSRTYTITPAIGYNIADVVLDGTTSLGAVTTYTFAPVTAAHTIAATFVAVAPHTITAAADTGGSISPDGAVSVAHRDSQAFTITPDSGYLVADVVLDGTTSLGTVTTYTFANVQTDHTISATFVAKSLVHQWSFNDGTANDSVGTAHGTLFGNTLPAITGGKLVLNPGSDQNQYMKTSAFTGETLGKRTLVAWVALSNLDQPGGAGVLGIHPAGVDNFDSIVYGERVAKQWMNGSNFYYRTVANNGGAAETSTDEVMMAIVYDSDNSIKLYRNGVRYDTGANQGTLVTRTAPIAILGRRQEGAAEDLQGAINEARIYNYALTDVEIQNLNNLGPDTLPGVYFDITASAGTGGAISPAGVWAVAESTTPTYTITPGIGYDVADVVLDAGTGSESHLGAVTTYTFAPVTAAHTITASFVAVVPHTITASAGTNGSISPNGAVSVDHRGSQAFTITPDSGYLVGDVVLDAGTGSETHLGPVTTYTFANVQTDHTISATFVAGSLVHQWTFNDGTANDTVGTAHGTLYGTATISDGKLSLSGSSETNRMQATLGNALGPNKTLVAWCSLSSLTPNNAAGSPLSVLNASGSFDAIVYGERTGGQWMNGSEFWSRTPANNLGALETLAAPNEIMMAITYDSYATNKIKLYRNGVLYAEHNLGSGVSLEAGANVLIGPRDQTIWNDGYMNGSINEARIYNYALTDVEIQNLYTQGPDTQPGGYAAWANANGFDPDHPEAVGNDGLTNLMVYALDLKTDGTNGSPGTLAGNVLSFTKRPEAVTNGDVTYAIEVSTDLGGTDPWHVTTTGVTEVVGPPATIAIDLSALGGTRHFARLKVTQ